MSEKTQKKSWFKGLSQEFKNVALGALIAVIDFVLQHGVEILVNLG